MFYEEIKPKQDFSYISICPLSILYNSKFILTATSLGTNAVVVTRVHYIRSIYLDTLLDFKAMLKGIALDKTLFSTKKYLYFSYFSTKTYVVGTH